MIQMVLEKDGSDISNRIKLSVIQPLLLDLIRVNVENLQSSIVASANSWPKQLSEVGFEPTPTEVDCDLNAAP